MRKRIVHFAASIGVMVGMDLIITILGDKPTQVSMFEMLMASFVVAWIFDKEK